ncbi:hypothetical protein BYT27DRAFT_7195706 [Phlegmacium glaucopus]|nr:hypothetical protein BYT27DRAFT_7195706 [Phlegmacium glaucopus]
MVSTPKPMITTAHFIQHNSQPTHYIHPYLFTHDSESTCEVYIWSSDDNSLYSTLEEAMADPREHHLIGTDRLLSLTNVSGSYKLSEILIHSLPEGDLIDSMPVGPLDSSGSEGNSSFLGVLEGNIAIWRNTGANGGHGVIEIYNLSTELGKLSLSDTLLPPQGYASLESRDVPGTFFPPKAIHISPHEFIGVEVSIDKFPSSIVVSRHTSSSNLSRQKQISLNFSAPTLPYPNADMCSTLCGDLYLPIHNELIMAHYEFPVGGSDPNPRTAIRCLEFDTLELKWCIILSEITCKVRYIPGLDAILSVGNGFTQVPAEDGTMKQVIPHLCITILDPSTGHSRASHVVGDPERCCGYLVWNDAAGISCDLTASGEEIAMIFGDGQSAVIPVEQLLESGFPRLEDGKIITTECPAIEPSVPSNEKQQNDLQNGNWHWVQQTFWGDKGVILQPTRGKGFAALSWK